MHLITRKSISTTKPVKAWKIITQLNDGVWITGYALNIPLIDGMWMKRAFTSSPGFHAFKSRQGATRSLYCLVRAGVVKNPAYVVPCYLRGNVEFGVYQLITTQTAKGIRGSELLIKTKHLPRGFYD